MTKEMFIKRWKESDKIKQIQRPLIFDCIQAEEIVYLAYKLGFIKWNVYSLAIEKIKRTRNSGSGLFNKPDIIRAYEKSIEEKYFESLLENQKNMHIT